MTEKESVKNKFDNFKTKTKTLLIGIVIGAFILLAIMMMVFKVFSSNKEVVEIDSNLLISKIVESSELTTAKINYKGIFEYKGEGYKFINKTEFMMVYEATARIGIDVNEVEVDADNEEKIVYIIIPKADIIDVKVDPTSIKYYDQKFKLFGFTEKEEANMAQALAEKEAKKELKTMGVIEHADKQSAILIKGILEGALPEDFEYEISYK
ncbi:MAG: DUF4230 domain-containing protein [Erysipelotrichaceae bacterium]|nr:DUF4230 domain-containing protein [Bacillota bacterium]